MARYPGLHKNQIMFDKNEAFCLDLYLRNTNALAAKSSTQNTQDSGAIFYHQNI
jgi:hypothetical protein